MGAKKLGAGRGRCDNFVAWEIVYVFGHFSQITRDGAQDGFGILGGEQNVMACCCGRERHGGDCEQDFDLGIEGAQSADCGFHRFHDLGVAVIDEAVLGCVIGACESSGAERLGLACFGVFKTFGETHGKDKDLGFSNRAAKGAGCVLKHFEAVCV